VLLTFVLSYLTLDWASYISPLQGLNLTPWNPAPALGLLLLMRSDRMAIPALFLAILLGDVFVRGIPGTLTTTLALDAILTAGYVLLGRVLKSRFPDGGLFTDRIGLLIWSAIIIFGSLANSLSFVTSLQVAGLLADDIWTQAVLRFWVGDAVGIFVTMPLLWWILDPTRRRIFLDNLLRLETWGYIGLSAILLWGVFALGAQVQFRYFYVLFLPVVWAASRQGLPGAVLAASLLQMGMLLVGLLVAPEEISIFEMQTRAFLLALVAFLIGAAVDDHRRAAAELKQSLRLAAAGEMAAALAHELNQPLTALTAYCAACEKMLQDLGGHEKLRQVVQRMMGEAVRAAEVVRRLRDFFRSGSIQLEPIHLADLIESVLAPFRDLAATNNIKLLVGHIPPQAVLNGDRLQLEVVIRNLMANAFDAVMENPGQAGEVEIKVQTRQNDRITILVEDNGPGPSSAMAGQLFEPFVSSKSSGLGLGLAISRAIAEAHGGNLLPDFVGHGCFRLTLPLDTQ
jgi:signal transduction histidine kinase